MATERSLHGRVATWGRGRPGGAHLHRDSFLQPILGSHGLAIKKNGLPGPSVALNKSVVVGSRVAHASWEEVEKPLNLTEGRTK